MKAYYIFPLYIRNVNIPYLHGSTPRNILNVIPVVRWTLFLDLSLFIAMYLF